MLTYMISAVQAFIIPSDHKQSAELFNTVNTRILSNTTQTATFVQVYGVSQMVFIAPIISLLFMLFCYQYFLCLCRNFEQTNINHINQEHEHSSVSTQLQDNNEIITAMPTIELIVLTPGENNLTASLPQSPVTNANQENNRTQSRTIFGR